MRAWTALAAAALLSACAFWSSEPLFSENEAASPFADGQVVLWRENGASEEAQRLVYRRAGNRYNLSSFEEGESPIPVLFFSVSDTPEEDYIVQTPLEKGEQSRVYVFMWRTEQGFRFVSAPRSLEAAPGAAQALSELCVQRPNGECRLARREDVLALYTRLVYPTFVAGGATPSSYIDQIAVSGDE